MAAERCLAAHLRHRGYGVLFDMIVVAREHWPRHVVAAIDVKE